MVKTIKMKHLYLFNTIVNCDKRGLVWQDCTVGIGPPCTTYSSIKITEGYNFSQTLHSNATNELLILSLFILAFLFQFY